MQEIKIEGYWDSEKNGIALYDCLKKKLGLPEDMYVYAKKSNFKIYNLYDSDDRLLYCPEILID